MRKFYTVLLCLHFFSYLQAQPSISYQTFLTGLSSPVEIVNAGDGSNRLFIVQQTGAIKVYDPANGGLQSTPFLDLTSLVTYAGDERGLLSLAFHPDYKNNGYFFVYYNNKTGNGDVTIARYKVSANRNVADATSGVVLFTITKPFVNHNGGHLQFRKDGAVYNLYFATGDGGSGNDPNNNAQTGTSLLGKMIRINVDNFNTAPYYTVPANNPYVGNASFDSRVWAYGFRNPFRWSFDRQTGDIWIGDVGQNAKEEVDYRPVSSTGGENFGWRCYEGSIRNPNIAPCDPPNYYPPIFDYNQPPSGGSSVIGGYVYRGSEFPFFNGYYMATDFYIGAVYLIKPNGSGGWNITQQAGVKTNISSFGEAEDGTLYATHLTSGTVYKVVATSSALPVSFINFTVQRAANANEIKWTTAHESISTKFIIEYSLDGNRFTKAGEVAGSGNTNGASYSFVHTINNNATLFYRLTMVEADGNMPYSSIVKVERRENSIQVYPTIVRDGRFFINSNTAIKSIQVINNNGSVVFEKIFSSFNNPETIQLPLFAKGIYVVRTVGDNIRSFKIVIE